MYNKNWLGVSMEIKLDKKADKILENLLSNSKNSIEYKLGLKISESILLLENEKKLFIRY